MSFGGSNSNTGVSAHVHDNNIGEGGALSNSLTQIGSVTLSSRIITGV